MKNFNDAQSKLVSGDDPPVKCKRIMKNSTLLKSVIKAVCAGAGDAAGCNDYDVYNRVRLMRTLNAVSSAKDLKSVESKIRDFVATGNDNF